MQREDQVNSRIQWPLCKLVTTHDIESNKRVPCIRLYRWMCVQMDRLVPTVVPASALAAKDIAGPGTPFVQMQPSASLPFHEVWLRGLVWNHDDPRSRLAH